MTAERAGDLDAAGAFLESATAILCHISVDGDNTALVQGIEALIEKAMREIDARIESDRADQQTAPPQ